MKILLLAVVALAIGAALGVASTHLELPEKPSVAVAYLNAAATKGDEDSTIGPRVEVVNGELHDFGRMDRMAKLSHAFIIRNSGDAPLKLEKGETTCKCTVSALANESLAPGEQTEVLLEWTAKTDASEFSQSAELLTNDPARHKVRLLVKGLVIQSVRPDRTEMSFNNLPANQATSGHMKIYGFRDEPVQIIKHEWLDKKSADYFDASFRPLAEDEIDKGIGAQSGVEMTVKLKSGLPLGPIAQTIRLTSNYDLPPFEVPILGRIVGDITFVGPKFRSDLNILSLNLIPRDEGARVTLRAIIKGDHRNDVQLEIESIEPQGALEATLGEPDRNEQVVTVPLTIEVPRGAPAGSHLGAGGSKAGRIIIKTNHPQAERIEIEVRFAVNP
jgi:hypothetical protein